MIANLKMNLRKELDELNNTKKSLVARELPNSYGKNSNNGFMFTTTALKNHTK